MRQNGCYEMEDCFCLKSRFLSIRLLACLFITDLCLSSMRTHPHSSPPHISVSFFACNPPSCIHTSPPSPTADVSLSLMRPPSHTRTTTYTHTHKHIQRTLNAIRQFAAGNQCSFNWMSSDRSLTAHIELWTMESTHRVLEHSLICSLFHSRHSLICGLRIACCFRMLCCAHSLARSLTP